MVRPASHLLAAAAAELGHSGGVAAEAVVVIASKLLWRFSAFFINLNAASLSLVFVTYRDGGRAREGGGIRRRYQPPLLGLPLWFDRA